MNEFAEILKLVQQMNRAKETKMTKEEETDHKNICRLFNDVADTISSFHDCKKVENAAGPDAVVAVLVNVLSFFIAAHGTEPAQVIMTLAKVEKRIFDATIDYARKGVDWPPARLK